MIYSKPKPKYITKVCQSCGGKHKFLTAEDVKQHTGYIGEFKMGQGAYMFNCACRSTLAILKPKEKKCYFIC